MLRCHWDLERASILPGSDWRLRQRIVLQAEDEVRRRFLQYLDVSDPFQRFMELAAGDTLATLHLLVYRPMQRDGKDRPIVENFDILDSATVVLERSILKQSDPTIAQWSWLKWVKWYGLAVALSELCCRTTGAAVVRAWYIVENAYEQYSEYIADTSSGMLWKPVTKLMKRARHVRDRAQRSGTIENDSHTALADLQKRHPDNGTECSMNHVSLDQPEQDNELMDLFVDADLNVDLSADSQHELSWLNWQSFLEDLSSGNINLG
jgi:hypothetical protein